MMDLLLLTISNQMIRDDMVAPLTVSVQEKSSTTMEAESLRESSTDGQLNSKLQIVTPEGYASKPKGKELVIWTLLILKDSIYPRLHFGQRNP